MVENRGHESHQMPREASRNFMNTLDAFLQAQCRVYEMNPSSFATYPVQEGKGICPYVPRLQHPSKHAPASLKNLLSLHKHNAGAFRPFTSAFMNLC